MWKYYSRIFFKRKNFNTPCLSCNIDSHMNFCRPFIRKMSSGVFLKQLKPPRNEGMTKLDKSKFLVTKKVWALLLPEIRYINEFIGRKKPSSSSIALSIPQKPSLVEYTKEELSDEEYKKISLKNTKLKALLLKDDIRVTENDERGLNTEPELLKCNVPKSTYKRLKEIGAIYKIHTLNFDFDYWPYDDILKAILPDSLVEQCPSAFTVAGHLAHLNLKEQYMPYRHIIGEVILEKFPNIKTVVNKTNNITSEFRTFEMEILAGEDNLVVTQKESGCQFTFDFGKVYWNSRLATEHERLIKSFGTGKIVCDVMGGVGPFAIPAGKKPCLVFANDLNPESFKYLKMNINQNKVDQFVKPSNLDGREFIRKSPQLIAEFQRSTPYIKYTDKSQGPGKRQKKQVSDEDQDAQPSKKRKQLQFDVPLFPSHYVMNLPDSAITFVDSYVGLYTNGYPNMTKEQIKNLPGYKLPIINVHHFEKYKEDEVEGDIEKELEKRIHSKIVNQLNYDIPVSDIKYHVVRQVAPCKLMYCISFKLPEDVAFAA